MGLRSFGSSEYGIVASFCEYCNKPSSAIKSRKYLPASTFIYIHKNWLQQPSRYVVPYFLRSHILFNLNNFYTNRKVAGSIPDGDTGIFQ
jgi:hypothetical protein